MQADVAACRTLEQPGRGAGKIIGFQPVVQFIAQTRIEQTQCVQGHVAIAVRVQDGTVGLDRLGVPGQCLGVEADQQPGRFAMGEQRPVGHAHVEIAVPAGDIGMVFPPAVNLPPAPGTGAGEDLCHAQHPAALGAADAPGKTPVFVHHCAIHAGSGRHRG